MNNILIWILSGVFFLSGFAALIYQVAWQRLLTVYYGVGSISITLIVSVYMAGLGLGALAGGVLSEKIKNRLGFYCLIELLIGIFGLVSPFLLDALGKSTAGSSYVLAFFYMTLFLIFPTVLMGMTLPVLTKIFNAIVRDFFNTISFLYFINTLGAAIGSVVASYYLISFWGLDIAVYCAAVINFCMAAGIFLASRLSVRSEAIPSGGRGTAATPQTQCWGRMAYVWIFVTGFMAIGYEMVWFRLTSFLVKHSPYGFSSALAVYLLGIALGSLGMNRVLRRRPDIDRINLFFGLQFLIGASVALIFLGFYYATKFTGFAQWPELSFHQEVHPAWVGFYKLLPRGDLVRWGHTVYAFFDIFLWPFFFVFVPTLFMGATFPVIASLALTEPRREGTAVGKIYFCNILGNVFGGVLTGFVLLAFWGTELTVLVFCGAGILFGFFVVKNFLPRQKAIVGQVLLVMLLAATVGLFPKKGQLYTLLHFPEESQGRAFYLEEGIDGVVGTFQKGDEVKNFIHGNEHGGRPGDFFYFQAIYAMSYAPKIDHVLIIGYGTGSTLEAVLKSTEVRQVTLVELNRTLIKNLTKMPLFKDMLADPRVDLVFDDGRRYLLRTKDQYDLVLMDPLRTSTVYSNNLYSRQFLQIVAEHLAPLGVFEMWSDERPASGRTISSVFPVMQVYGSFFIASKVPHKFNVGRALTLAAMLWPDKPGQLVELGNQEALRYYFSTSKQNTASLLVNQDWRPCVEYFIGLVQKYENFNALTGQNGL